MPKKTFTVYYKNIHRDFTDELSREWKEHGFSFEQTADWITIGLTPTDAYYAAWLRDIKQKDCDWVLNYGDNQALRSEYKNWQLQELANLKVPSCQPSTFPRKLLLIMAVLMAIVLYFLLTK